MGPLRVPQLNMRGQGPGNFPGGRIQLGGGGGVFGGVLLGRIGESGETFVIGNVIQQGNNTSNRAMLDYASEGLSPGYDNHLYVVNNTFVSRRGAGATFVQLANAPTCLAANNLFIGTGNVSNLPASVQMTTNLTDAQGDPRFVNEPAYDFHLQQGSPAAGAGSDPGKSMTGFSLSPVNQYKEPAGGEARPVKGKLDVGAFAAP